MHLPTSIVRALRAVAVPAIASLGIAAVARPVAAQSGAIVTSNNHCVIPDGSRAMRVYACSQGGARYYIANGVVKTADNFCMDHRVAKGVNPAAANDGVILLPCNGSATQTWYFMTSGANQFMAQNAGNPAVCLNIEGGNDNPGTRLIVWPCGFGHAAANEKFYPGGTVSGTSGLALLSQILPPNAYKAVTSGGMATFSNGARIVAQGAGNIIAAGSPSFVTQQGAGIVAQGAGNLMADGGASLRAAFNGASLVGTSGGR